jgi:Fe-Mn family superoxide dismutase
MDNKVVHKSGHLLPDLPYEVEALEPHIKARTIMLHHDKHHASYVANLNAALEIFPDLHEHSASWLLTHLDKVPKKIRIAVRNNAGGHVNHSMYWRAMAPAADSSPTGLLADALVRDFGSIEKFKLKFEQAGTRLFGSGWVWLARAQLDGGKLQIYTTTGHANPLMKGHFPILVNDVWEHAYYLDYQNRRGDYLKAWWAITNWHEARRRFEKSDKSDVRDWEDEGGLVPELTK